MIHSVDLFCGAGGLTHGLLNAGINVIAGYDIEESCRYAYEENNKAKFILKDVTSLKASDLELLFPKSGFRLLAGCAPCQPFSSYSRTAKNKDEKKWNLLTSFEALVRDALPDFVTMENVPGLVKQDVFSSFLKTLKSKNYHVDYKIIFCPDYGMAQSRKRLVLVASRHGEISILPPTHTPDRYITVRDAIGHLPAIKAGETHVSDRLHKSQNLSSLNLKRIISSKPGGTWLDWPEDIRANCHKSTKGKTYTSVYGRMSWDKVSPTITTQCIGYGNGRFGHPEQNRAISLREAAILQSFPLNYQFFPENRKHDLAPLAKMIGNAVPVKLGEVVGESILSHMRSLLKNQ